MTATIIAFPRSPAAPPAPALLDRPAELGDRVLVLGEGVTGTVVGETVAGPPRLAVLVRGEVHVISPLRIAPIAPAPGTGGAA